jgi:hypothetical protein
LDSRPTASLAIEERRVGRPLHGDRDVVKTKPPAEFTLADGTAILANALPDLFDDRDLVRVSRRGGDRAGSIRGTP